MPCFAALKIRPILLLAATAAAVLTPLTAIAIEFKLTDFNTGTSQFSDLRPADWAYQALTNLAEKYGCVAGYPNSSFRGGQTMTRFEAAALLGACLDRVTAVTDTLKRLIAEFAQELTVLKAVSLASKQKRAKSRPASSPPPPSSPAWPPSWWVG